MPAKSPAVAAEVREIKKETSESRFQHKVACLELLADGWSYADAAKAHHYDPTTLKRWWRKAKKQGVRSLREVPRSGRPSKLPPQIRAEVLAAIKRPPMKIGLPGYKWTGPMLVSFVEKRSGMKISLRSAQNLLRDGA